MAQFLYERHSTNVHLNAAKRHIRLARQVKGAEEFANAIEPPYNELTTKVASSKLATEECESKRDMLILKDSLLVDKLRDVMEASKKFDRDNPGAIITSTLFPDGLTSIIYAPTETKPLLAENIIIGIQSLGEDHQLTTLILPLRTAINECKIAIDELHTAIEAEKTTQAFESIAKLNLTRQYGQNIHSASMKFGKQFINRLFPVIRVAQKSDNKATVPAPAK